MLLFLRPFIIALSLFLVVNVGLNYLVQHTTVGEKLDAIVANKLPLKLKDVARTNQKEPIDVLALGTSLTDDGFVPSVFEHAIGLNVSSYNMGLPATRYDVLKTYLDYHTVHFGKPKVVLIEVTDYMLNRDDYYYYMPVQYYQTLISQWKQFNPLDAANQELPQHDKTEIFLSTWSSLYRYRGVLSPIMLYTKASGELKARFAGASPTSERISIKTTQLDTQLDVLPLKGWHPRFIESYMQSNDGIRRNAHSLKQVYLDSLNELNFSKLSNLIQYCKSKNIRVVLVQWPNHPEYFKLFKQSKMYNSFQTGIDRITQEYQVDYVNLNQDLPKETNGLFADCRHLSKEGAIYFSRILSEKIAYQ